MTLNEFKQRYNNGARVIDDKETIINVVNSMACLPTSEMYSPTLTYTPRSSDTKVYLRNKALGYFENVLNDKNLPETLPELLIKISERFKKVQIPDEVENTYTYLAQLAEGRILKTHETNNI